MWKATMSQEFGLFVAGKKCTYNFDREISQSNVHFKAQEVDGETLRLIMKQNDEIIQDRPMIDFGISSFDSSDHATTMLVIHIFSHTISITLKYSNMTKPIIQSYIFLRNDFL